MSYSRNGKPTRGNAVTLLPVLFSCAFLAAPAAGALEGQPVQNIRLTAAGDIADASAVNRAISDLVKDVASCRPETQGSQSCACGFKDDLKKLAAAYDAAVAKHPAWSEADTVVIYNDPADGKSIAVVFPNLRRQLEACSVR